jgi:AsmA protein
MPAMRLMLKLIFALILLAIAALVAIPFFIDPNDYKPQIESAVEEATGRQLTLDGDIELSVFPWIALEMGPLALSNAKGFKAEHFAKVEKVEVRVKLMPLLKKQLEMDTVILDGLALNLETNKAGVTNWDDLAQGGDSKPEDKTKSDSAAPALAAVTIGGVRITDANISFVDDDAGASYLLKQFNLETDPLVPGEPTAVAMSFDISTSEPKADAHIELATEVTLDMAAQTLTLDSVQLAVAATTETQKLDAQLSGDIATNLASQLTEISPLSLKAELEDPALPGGKANVELSTHIKADLNKQTLQLSDLLLTLQDLVLNANVSANKILSDAPAFSGDVHIQPFNARQLAKTLQIELPPMADTSTLKNIEVKTGFSGGLNQFNAKQMSVTLDDSTLTGDVGVRNFAQPALTFALKLDEIDTDRYMPPVEEGEPAPAATPATAAPGGSSELPLEALRQLNANGTIDIGKMKATNLISENIHATLKANGGLVHLYPMRADIYQGQYNGNVKLDASGNNLKLTINEKVDNVQAQPLLNDLLGEAPISGLANATIALTGAGKTIDAIKATLNGKGNFAFTEGAVQGVNIAESIRKAKAAFSGQKVADSGEPVQTDFSSLTGSFTVKNGIVDNQDLAMKSPLLRLSGAGQADLPQELIDYALKVAIVGTLSGQGGEELADLKGLTIPVKITGPFNAPKPTVDLASLLKDKAKQELKTKAQEKVKEKLGGELGGLLGGALGGQTTQETTEKEVAPESEPAPEAAPTPEKQIEDALKDKLKGFF